MEYKYELAISLLEEDAQIGWDIVAKLGNPDKIFFYKKDVDDLTFRNGLNVFSEIFSEQARFVLVLHRANYGNTDWTAIENSVIQERFKKTIKTGSSPILFCKVDKSANPSWLPETYIYHSIGQLDELVRSIRKRITDLGGECFPQSTEERLRMELKKRDYEEYFQKQVYLSQDMAEQARSEAENLKNRLHDKLERVARDNKLFFKNQPEFITGNIPIAILNATFDKFTITLRDKQHAINSIDNAFVAVTIEDYEKVLREYEKRFYITINGIKGWRDLNNKNFLSTDAFIELIFQDIVNLLSLQN